jgi:hypothetical protein
VIIIVLVYQREFVKARRSFVHGTLMFEERRAYDAAGRVVEERQTFCAGLGDEVTTRTYDDRGLLLEQSSLDRDGKVRSTQQYAREFDEQGNWTMETLICWPRGCNASGVCDMENSATLVTLRTIVYEPHCA